MTWHIRNSPEPLPWLVPSFVLLQLTALGHGLSHSPRLACHSLSQRSLQRLSRHPLRSLILQLPISADSGYWDRKCTHGRLGSRLVGVMLLLCHKRGWWAVLSWGVVKSQDDKDQLQQSKLLFDSERFHDDETVPEKSGHP